MIPPAQQVVRRAAVTEEDRRRKRMTSNRLSARKTRMKKQQYVDDLTALAGQLKQENEAVRASASVALEQCRLLEQENRVLMAHARELCSVLQLRNFQLRLLGDVAGLPLDVPDVGDHLMQLYGGLQMPLSPPPPLPLRPQVQMLAQPDVMDAVRISMLEF